MATTPLVWGVVFLLSLGSFLFPSSPAEAVESESGIVIVGGAGVVSEALAEHLGLCTTGAVERIAGADRFKTAAAIAERWNGSVDTIFLATGLDFPDAVTAGPVATLSGSPLLLTHPTTIPAITNQALVHLSPNRIVLLGGPGAISAAIEADLRARFSEVVRLGGLDRYGTAVELSAWHFRTGADVAYIVTGADFPDALIAGPLAARDDAPLLLVAENSVPSATRQELVRLAPQRIVVVGSSGISDSVMNELTGYAREGVDRLAGGSRYETAVAAATGTSGSKVFIVTGEDFADGLSATPLAGDAPLLFVKTNLLHATTAEAIGEHTGVACDPWSPPFPQIGSGKRILYSNSQQRVWLIDEYESLVDTYLVSGREGVPRPGTYTVYSKSVYTRASYGGITMKHMVRFVPPYTFGNRLAYGFHSIPRYPDGRPMQTEDQLGSFLSGGCVRQADHKAEALYGWAPIGTTVIALP